MIGGDDAAGIAQMGCECEIELIALFDLVDRHQRAFAHLAGHHRVRPRLGGEYEAERDGRLCHEKPESCVAIISSQECRSVTLYHQTALRVIWASPCIKKGPASD